MGRNMEHDIIRPTKTAGLSTRERCLDAAAAVLSLRGYAGTRLSDIAAEAQVQTPALYYYFESRETLIEEVVGLGQKETDAIVSEALAEIPDATPTERIRVAIAAHLESIFLRRSAYARAATRTMSQLPPEAQERLRTAHRSYIDLWLDLFTAAHEAGELSPTLDPKLARMVVLGALNWATEWWRPERGPLENLIATAQEIVVRGIRAEAH